MYSSADVLWLGSVSATNKQPTRSDKFNWSDLYFYFFNKYLLYPVVCTDSQVVYVHEIFRRIVVGFVKTDAAGKKELVLVVFDWQLEKFKSPFEAEEPHGWSP